MDCLEVYLRSIMGNNLVDEKPPKHIVNLKTEIATRGWKRALVARQLTTIHIMSGKKQTVQADDIFREISLDDEETAETSVNVCNNWGLLAHYSNKFPSDQEILIVFGEGENQCIIDCSGAVTDDTNERIAEMQKIYDSCICIVCEKENAAIVFHLFDYERAMLLWCPRVDRITNVSVIAVDKDSDANTINDVGHCPEHRNKLMLIIGNGISTETTVMDAIACDNTALRIKYNYIYLHKMEDVKQPIAGRCLLRGSRNMAS